MPGDGFLYPVPTAKPADDPLFIVGFNALWLPILLDAVDNLQHASYFDSPPDDITGQIEELLKQLQTEVSAMSQIFKPNVDFWHDRANLDIGSSWSTVLNTGQRYNTYTFNSAGAQNDQFSQEFIAKAGTYTLHIYGLKNNLSGIVTWSIDGVDIGTNDWFASSTTFNQSQDISGAVISADGLHTLTGQIRSTSGGSTAYRAYLTSYWLERTGD